MKPLGGFLSVIRMEGKGWKRMRICSFNLFWKRMWLV